MSQLRDKWIVAALHALVEGGVGAVRVEAIARSLGVTKGSFYHHFANRPALFEAMLSHWESAHTLELIAHAELQRSPSAKFRALTGAIFMQTSGDPIEAAIRAWGSSDERARVVLNAVDTRRVDYVQALFVEMGFGPERASWRAQAFYRLVIGDFMWRAVGESPLSSGAQQELIELFLAP